MSEKLVVHTFSMGDVEDPTLYAAEPIMKWQKSEAGKFVMKNALGDPVFTSSPDLSYYGYKFKIIAELSETDATYFKLKWHNYGFE